jgi:hypothetical protein
VQAVLVSEANDAMHLMRDLGGSVGGQADGYYIPEEKSRWRFAANTATADRQRNQLLLSAPKPGRPDATRFDSWEISHHCAHFHSGQFF